MQLLGLGLLSLTLLMWIVTGGIELAFQLGILASGATTIGGIVMFARGTQQVVRTTRHLRTATAMRQLPVARLR